jgi:hypothetical protein
VVERQWAGPRDRELQGTNLDELPATQRESLDSLPVDAGARARAEIDEEQVINQDL